MVSAAIEAIFARYTLAFCEPYIQFAEDRYTKHILERTPGHEVVLICWKAGQQTPIHDHPAGGCWLSVLRGALEETTYTVREDGPEKQGAQQLVGGTRGFQRGAEGVHAIRALEDTISLHVYCPSGYIARTYTHAV